MTLRQPPLPTDIRSTQVSELLIIPLRIDLKRTRLYMLYRHYLGIHHSDYGFATMLLELAQDFILGVHHLYRELEEMREMGVIAYVCDAYEEEHRDVFYRRLREELWWVLDDLLGVIDGDGERLKRYQHAYILPGAIALSYIASLDDANLLAYLNDGVS